MRIASTIVSLALILPGASVLAQGRMLAAPPSGVIDVQEAMLSPEIRIAKAPAPDRLILGKAQLDARNARMAVEDTDGVIHPDRSGREHVTVTIVSVTPLLADENFPCVDAMPPGTCRAMTSQLSIAQRSKAEQA